MKLSLDFFLISVGALASYYLYQSDFIFRKSPLEKFSKTLQPMAARLRPLPSSQRSAVTSKRLRSKARHYYQATVITSVSTPLLTRNKDAGIYPGYPKVYRITYEAGWYFFSFLCSFGSNDTAAEWRMQQNMALFERFMFTTIIYVVFRIVIYMGGGGRPVYHFTEFEPVNYAICPDYDLLYDSGFYNELLTLAIKHFALPHESMKNYIFYVAARQDLASLVPRMYDLYISIRRRGFHALQEYINLEAKFTELRLACFAHIESFQRLYPYSVPPDNLHELLSSPPNFDGSLNYIPQSQPVAQVVQPAPAPAPMPQSVIPAPPVVKTPTSVPARPQVSIPRPPVRTGPAPIAPSVNSSPKFPAPGGLPNPKGSKPADARINSQVKTK